MMRDPDVEDYQFAKQLLAHLDEKQAYDEDAVMAALRKIDPVHSDRHISPARVQELYEEAAQRIASVLNKGTLH